MGTEIIYKNKTENFDQNIYQQSQKSYKIINNCIKSITNITKGTGAIYKYKTEICNRKICQKSQIILNTLKIAERVPRQFTKVGKL